MARGASDASADVFALSGDSVLSLAAADVAAPVPSGADDDVLPAVRQAGERDGQRFGVPFVWGPELLASRKAFPTAPMSFDSLYDPAFAGRIAVPDDPLQVALAALVLGTGDPYALNAADLDAAGQLVQRQRPLVREYWSHLSDLAGLFADGRIVLGQARGKVAASLAPLGVDATLPDGPALGWSDWFVIAARAPHPAAPRSGATTRCPRPCRSRSRTTPPAARRCTARVPSKGRRRARPTTSTTARCSVRCTSPARRSSRRASARGSRRGPRHGADFPYTRAGGWVRVGCRPRRDGRRRPARRRHDALRRDRGDRRGPGPRLPPALRSRRREREQAR